MYALKRSNILFEGANNKQSLLDMEIPSKWNGKVILFSHGFMGFKDWGAWHLVQSFFVKRGYGFVNITVAIMVVPRITPLIFLILNLLATTLTQKNLETMIA